MMKPVYGALTIEIVEPGTVRVYPETGIAMTVEDACSVIDQGRGIAWVTAHTWDLLKTLTSPIGNKEGKA